MEPTPKSSDMDPLCALLYRPHHCLPPNPSSLPPEKGRQLSCMMELSSFLLTTAYLHIITLIPLNSTPALSQAREFIFLDIMALNSH